MSDASKSWIQCFSGGRFYPLDPHPADVRVPDIAHALSNLCRFTGHGRWYSVAEHSVLVSRLAPKMCGDRWCRLCGVRGLFHDAAEAYIGDLNSPTKHQTEMAPFRIAEELIMDAIFTALKFPHDPSPANGYIHQADQAILANEARFIFGRKLDTAWELGPAVRGVKIEGWPPHRAELEFLKRYHELFPERKNERVQNGCNPKQ